VRPFTRTPVFNLEPQRPQSSFESAGGPEGFVPADQPQPELGGPGPTYGNVASGAMKLMTPSQRSGELFARSIGPAIRPYVENPLWAAAQQADYTRALSSLGKVPPVAPPVETPGDVIEGLLTEQGVEVDDEDEKKRRTAGET